MKWGFKDLFPHQSTMDHLIAHNHKKQYSVVFRAADSDWNGENIDADLKEI